MSWQSSGLMSTVSYIPVAVLPWCIIIYCDHWNSIVCVEVVFLIFSSREIPNHQVEPTWVTWRHFRCDIVRVTLFFHGSSSSMLRGFSTHSSSINQQVMTMVSCQACPKLKLSRDPSSTCNAEAKRQALAAIILSTSPKVSKKSNGSLVGSITLQRKVWIAAARAQWM